MSMGMHDTLEGRMKLYEDAEAGRALMPFLPAMARLDGRCFTTFTKHAKKPFSDVFEKLMEGTARFLVEETGATVAYTQSDEITLAWRPSELNTSTFFGGRIQKMTSQIAALASAKFNALLMVLAQKPVMIEGKLVEVDGQLHSELAKSGLAWRKLPTFDCRVWNVPTPIEGANVFVWRQQDASRNSVQMLARHYFSHKECTDKSTSELQDMLMEKFQVNWNDLPARSKRGVFVRRVVRERIFTPEETALLPEKHQAHTDPHLKVVRQDLELVDLWLTRIANREDSLFYGATPRPVVAYAREDE